MKPRQILRAALAIPAILLLAGCLATSKTSRGTAVEATITTDPETKVRNVHFVWKNRPDMNVSINETELAEHGRNAQHLSCLELGFFGIQADLMLKSAVDPRKRVLMPPSEKEKLFTINKPHFVALDSESSCRCKNMRPNPPFAYLERRRLLRKTRKQTELNPEYMSLYPKDEKGQPRFLKMGEVIDRSVLEQLPEVELPPLERPGNCRSDCKESRARTNAKAIKEGKPEPWPNLKPAPLPACTDKRREELRAKWTDKRLKEIYSLAF